MRKVIKIESFSSGDTYQLGVRMGKQAKAGEVYCLNGDLGVGKTVFTQGFAKGLGIEGPVNSPTFTILQEYKGDRLPLYHFDVYRISDIEEMEEIGYDDYFFGEGVCLIEWAERIEEILPKNYIVITIKKDLQKGFDYREITVDPLIDREEGIE
ncbi:MAG: tRNA (adenosine(37)-N6)-threonylcarbamoyltransferase complex ATPase subunit type 1 TsaE [Clostridiales bacterium]|nr:tRNA (adenosine(37)-N6)-threonylcarbamoyltransferase complex ATPase subunit type 1 TsaE [Clostridiales bacterium]